MGARELKYSFSIQSACLQAVGRQGNGITETWRMVRNSHTRGLQFAWIEPLF